MVFVYNINSNLNFNGHKQLVREISTDFYTGKTVDKKNRTIEHILPKSKGGKNDIKNYAMTDVFINNKRGNMSLDTWIFLNPEYLNNMRNYVKKYWNTKIDNIKHGQEVSKTVKKIINIDLI